jgi:hypothetical protein
MPGSCRRGAWARRQLKRRTAATASAARQDLHKRVLEVLESLPRGIVRYRLEPRWAPGFEEDSRWCRSAAVWHGVGMDQKSGTARALAAAQAVADAHSVRCQDAVLLAGGSNVLVHPKPAPVVARVMTSTAVLHDDVELWLAREVAVGLSWRNEDWASRRVVFSHQGRTSMTASG